MRLLLVELNRFRSRRAIALLVLAAGVLAAVLAATALWNTRPVDATDLAAAREQAAQEAEQPYIKAELRRCEKRPERYGGPGTTAADCSEMVLPQPEWFLYREPLKLKRVNENEGTAAILLGAAVLIVAGTTFAGGDWASGSMSNQLLFEPRRTRVWLAKAAAVFLATLVVATLALLAFWGVMALVAGMRDIATPPRVWGDVRATVARGVLLTAFAAVGGYALTMLLRHTVGTMAVMFVYAVGGEVLIASLPFSGMGRWSLANNVAAWLNDGTTYWDDSLRCPPSQTMDCDQSVPISMLHGATYLGVILVLVALASVFFFRRRDIP